MKLEVPPTQRPDFAFHRAALATLLVGLVVGVDSITLGTKHVPMGRHWHEDPDHAVPPGYTFRAGSDGFIVAAIHDSFMDPFEGNRWLYGSPLWWQRLKNLFGRLVGRTPQPLRPQIEGTLVAKSSLFKFPLGLLSRPTRLIRLKRGDSQKAIDEAVAKVSTGMCVWIAPQGTNNPAYDVLDDGLPFKQGTVEIAQRTGKPIIPMAHFGTHRFPIPKLGMGKDGEWQRGTPVVTRFGAPIWVGPDEDLAEATERLRLAMQTLQRQVLDEYPDKPAPDEASTKKWWPARLGGAAPDGPQARAIHEEKRQKQKAKFAKKQAKKSGSSGS